MRRANPVTTPPRAPTLCLCATSSTRQIARREGKVEPRGGYLAPLLTVCAAVSGNAARTPSKFRHQGLGLGYGAGIRSHNRWAPGTGPRPPKKVVGAWAPPKLLRRDEEHKPARSTSWLALPKRAWRTITWREATGDKLFSRFARVRVRVAHRDYWLADSRPKEWLLIEWPDGEPPRVPEPIMSELSK